MRSNRTRSKTRDLRAGINSGGFSNIWFSLGALMFLIAFAGPALADPSVCENPQTGEKVSAGGTTTVGDELQRCCRRRPIHGQPKAALFIEESKFRRMPNRNRCWGAGFRSVDLIRVKIRPDQ